MMLLKLKRLLFNNNIGEFNSPIITLINIYTRNIHHTNKANAMKAIDIWHGNKKAIKIYS